MKTNGSATKSPPPDLVGAPRWFVATTKWHEARYGELHSKLDNVVVRVSALEQSVISDATVKGARAGRAWGAILGGIVAILSTLLSTCYSNAMTEHSVPTQQSR